MSTEGSAAVQRARGTRLAVNLGLLANVVLAAGKITVGLLGRSQALLADGINALSDVAYYIVVRVILSQAYKPADEDHPYGHERLESIGALVVATFILATGIGVLFGAVRSLWLGPGVEGFGEAPALLALWVALGSAALKVFLWLGTSRLARRTSNPALAALTEDHRNDILASLGAALGIVASRGGLPWADPLAAGIVALVILRSGVEVLRESSSDLMGRKLDPELNARIAGWAAAVPGVRRVESLRAHSFGPFLVLNITVGVDGGLSVMQGDVIADEVERVLRERIEMLRDVHVHYHPAP